MKQICQSCLAAQAEISRLRYILANSEYETLKLKSELEAIFVLAKKKKK